MSDALSDPDAVELGARETPRWLTRTITVVAVLISAAHIFQAFKPVLSESYNFV